MSKISLTINGKLITAEAGQSILNIATENGIEIPHLCYDESLEIYGGCGLCVAEAEGNPKLIRTCATIAADGMVVNTNTPRVVQSRKVSLEFLMSDHEGDCRGPCTLACPAGTQCQDYVKAIALGDDHEAVRIMKEGLPMPACIGRVCPHPCEDECRRQMVEEPISIAGLKYFAADIDMNSANPFKPEIAPATGKKIGIIGGGPAGLSAAYFLAAKGHDVTIYDAMPKMGGMFRYGIPEYRLPKAIVDMEIAQIADLGVKMKNDIKIGRDISFDDFRKNHDAVLVTIGAWIGSKIGVNGEDLDGVLSGIEFLEEVGLGKTPKMGKKVAVCGGGNVAMDACRTAVRLGAEEVYVVYRRTRAEMPAEDIEIEEAIEEGVIFKFLTNPAEIIGENGKVKTIKLQVMELGEPDASGRRAPVPVKDKFEYLDVDNVIQAIGQKVDPTGFNGLELNKKGIISADEGLFSTSIPGVFAAGDAVNKGAGIAVAAIGEAHKASNAMDLYLRGLEIPYKAPFYSEREVTEEMYEDEEIIHREKISHMKPDERKHTFKEMNYGYTEEQARAEAKRCLECGCHDYYDCQLIHYANQYDIHPERIAGDKHPTYTETALNVIERNQGKCILCGQCVRVCDEVVGAGILGLIGRGFDTVVKPEFNKPETIEICKTCLKCAELCPTGSLRIITE